MTALRLLPISGDSTSNALNYWYIPLAKREFEKPPEFYLGQKVLHRIPAPCGGSIYHLVTITGIDWHGTEWLYSIDLPPDHPQFIEGECEWKDWMDEYLFEAID